MSGWRHETLHKDQSLPLHRCANCYFLHQLPLAGVLKHKQVVDQADGQLPNNRFGTNHRTFLLNLCWSTRLMVGCVLYVVCVCVCTCTRLHWRAAISVRKEKEAEPRDLQPACLHMAPISLSEYPGRLASWELPVVWMRWTHAPQHYYSSWRRGYVCMFVCFALAKPWDLCLKKSWKWMQGLPIHSSCTKGHKRGSHMYILVSVLLLSVIISIDS